MNTIHYWIAAALVTLGIGAMAARGSEPEPEQPSAEQQRRDRAAAAICREQFGPEALHYWRDGQLICGRAI